MTATIRRSFALYRLWWIAATVLLIAGAGAGIMQWRLGAADAATSALTPTKAAQLVNATSGEAAVEMRAVGDEAKLINAALPFSKAAINAAQSFDMASDGGLDHRRALLCMTQAVYYEAGNESLQGRRAVAQVVLNRMRHPAFPKSVCGVVYQGWNQPVCQFSFVCDGSLYRQPAAYSWREAQDIAEAALNGYVEASVGMATHYHADYVAPRWAPMLSKISQIGAHIFYRWPGAWGMPASFTGRYIGEPRDPLTMRPPLRQAVADTLVGVPADESLPPTGPITDGTQLKRAPNDVGGLLDTSKGWTLNIPMPGEGGKADSVARSQGAAPAVVAASPVVAQVASR